MSTKSYTRIALVTGATSGIGEAASRKFIAAGFGVVGNARSASKLAALEQELGHAFCGVAGDASDHAVIEQLFHSAQTHFGKPADIVLANAGRGLGGSIYETDLSEFEQMLKINVSGTLAFIQKAAQSMLATINRRDSNLPKAAADIVIIGSVVGRHISPFSAAYSATKFAVHAMAEGLRREMGPQGIRVSLVEPGMVISGFQEGAHYAPEMVQNILNKVGRTPSAHDLANAIQYIVSQEPHVHISDMVVRPTGQEYP